MYAITITPKDGKCKKVVRPSEKFGIDAKGNRMSPAEIQDIARDMAWDTFGTQVASVTCVKSKYSE